MFNLKKISSSDLYYRCCNNINGYNDVPWMMFCDNYYDIAHYGKYCFVASGRNSVYAELLVKEINQINTELDYYENLFVEDINPTKIEVSAGIWDDQDFVQILWDRLLEPKGILKVKTNNGLIIFDSSLCKRIDKPPM